MLARGAVGAQVARHAPHRLRHDRDRDDLQPVQPGGVRDIAERGDAIGEDDHDAPPTGTVKPSQAASPPGRPARSMPIVMPIWLLAGPGRNWQSATMSA